jgi:hypothetical protein
VTQQGSGDRGGAPEAISSVLGRIVKDVRPTPRRSGIAELWSACAGSGLAADTCPAALDRGVLTIAVRSASLLAELDGFRREELLGRLVTLDPSGRIRGLRFRLEVF